MNNNAEFWHKMGFESRMIIFIKNCKHVTKSKMWQNTYIEVFCHIFLYSRRNFCTR